MTDILLSTYNGEKYLREQLYSIFSQDSTDFRIIARDDGSDDSTTAILREFETQFSDRMEIIHTDTKKHSAKDNFRELMKHSDAEYVMLCDQDDFWNSDKISLCIKEMENQPSDIPVLIHTDAAVADENLDIIHESLSDFLGISPETATLENLLVYNCVTGCTLMMNRALCDIAVNMPDEAVMHDWWIALCAMVFGKIIYIDKATMLYRQHSSNVVGAQRKNVFSVIPDAKKIHLRLNDSYIQAEAFLRTFRGKIPYDKHSVIRGYAVFRKLGKFEKAVAIARYGYTKSTVTKTIGQMILS